jgi:hypothetical protein
MKKCLKCGREYAEEREICEADGAPLIPIERIFNAADETPRAGETVDETGDTRAAGAPPVSAASRDQAMMSPPIPPHQIDAAPTVVDTPETDLTQNINQWKIALTAFVILTFALGGLYLYHKDDTNSAPNGEPPPLAADPNAKPLKQISAPTGDAEKNIALNVQTNANGEAIDPITGKTKDAAAPPIKKTGEIYNSNAPTDSPFIPTDDPTRTYKVDDATGAALVSEAGVGGKGAKNKNEKAANANTSANANASAKNSNAAPRNANAKENAPNANHNAANSAPKPTPAEKKSAPPAAAGGKANDKKNAPRE